MTKIDNTETNSPQYFAVVPAAGMGKRMSADCPKQYLKINDKTVIEHTIEKLLNVERLQKIIIAVSEHDQHWQTIELLKNPRIEIVNGGVERCISVFNGLLALDKKCNNNDWVLVHDVARPCVSVNDINKLIDQLTDKTVGGLLATPVTDTVKQVDSDGYVIETLDRSCLWRAQTPQMFRFQLLLNALEQSINSGESITDEASAVELAGFSVAVIEGSSENIKITRSEDLPLADFYLQQQYLQQQ
jgi:2-C-methyl-D-erythritol 4-phosphate cytidylyltransferase